MIVPEHQLPDDVLAARIFNDGMIASIIPLICGRARLVAGRDWMAYDKSY